MAARATVRDDGQGQADNHGCHGRKTALANAVSAAILAGTACGPALAQQHDSPAIEEVIVTATKRAESLMDVPLAITALSGENIRDVNLDDVKDLVAFTPGITGNTKDSFLDNIAVRGIRTIDFGNGGDPSVSVYKNGLYQGRNGSAVISLFDVERAEILRGPQGFLFGRNSVAGAMNVITVKPNVERTEGYVEADVGERGHLVVEGAVNFALGEQFAARLSGYRSGEDGYVENIFGGPDLIAHDKRAFRGTARWQTEGLTADFMLEYEERDQTGTVYRQNGEGASYSVVQARINGGIPPLVPADPIAVNNDNLIGTIDNGEIVSAQLLIEYELDTFAFTSITGFKDHEYDYIEDFDGAPVVLFNYGQDQEGDYIEQEFRLTSNTDGPLSWYAGVSWYDEDIDTVFLGQQAEDAYCGAYWFQACQDVFDYYNDLDAYYGNTYYCDYLLDYYFGSCTWTPSSQSIDGISLINDRNRIIGRYSGFSTYADLGYRFNDSFDISFGVRYAYDRKDFSQQSLADPGSSLLAYRVQTGFRTPNGPLRDKQDWDDLTYRLVMNYRPTDTDLLFLSVTTGYKPGGFGSFNIEPGFPGFVYGRYVVDYAVDKPADFDSETVISYELGYKGTLFDGRTQLAANAFFFDYEDLQAIFGLGPITIVDNVGQVDGRGFELDASTALTDNVDIRFGFSWFDSEASNVQAFCGDGERISGDPDACEGRSIPWAPEWTAFAVLNGALPLGAGEVFGRLAWTREDERRVDWAPKSVLFQRVDGINQTDLALGYRSDSWQVYGYLENLTDETWYDGAGDGGNPANPYTQYDFGPARPRTFGVRASFEF